MSLAAYFFQRRHSVGTNPGTGPITITVDFATVDFDDADFSTT
jgi:hypothetical protein